MKVIFFSKYSIFYVDLEDEIKFRENLHAFELKPLISVIYDKNACERPSTCEKAVVRLPIALKDITNNLICLILV